MLSIEKTFIQRTGKRFEEEARSTLKRIKKSERENSV